MKRTILLVASLLLFVLGSPIAQAAPPSEEDAKKVVKLSAQAAVQYDKGNYDKALEQYKKAHTLWANPKLSFSIVKCLEALKRYREALEVAQRGLKENPKSVLKSRLESKVTFLNKILSKGRLRLTIRPSGSTVSIDGKSVGTAPLDVQILEPGKHELKITHPNYANIVQGITVNGGAELALSFTLQPLSGKLSISSTPSGAEVLIDGKSWGKTPLSNLTIPTGSHAVTVKYPGYKAATRRVNVSPEQAESITVVLSEPSTKTPAGSTAGPWFRSWPGWTALAIGLGAGAAGGILLFRANQAHTTVRAAINQPSSTTLSQKALTDQWNQANGEERVGIALAAAGGGVIIIAVILFATRTGTGTQNPKTSSLPPSGKGTAKAGTILLYQAE